MGTLQTSNDSRITAATIPRSQLYFSVHISSVQKRLSCWRSQAIYLAGGSGSLFCSESLLSGSVKNLVVMLRPKKALLRSGRPFRTRSFGFWFRSQHRSIRAQQRVEINLEGEISEATEQRPGEQASDREKTTARHQPAVDDDDTIHPDENFVVCLASVWSSFSPMTPLTIWFG